MTRRHGEVATIAKSPKRPLTGPLYRLVIPRPGLRAALPYLAIAFGIVAIGMSGIFVKWAGAPGAVSGFYRMAIAAAVMAIPFAAQVLSLRAKRSRSILQGSNPQSTVGIASGKNRPRNDNQVLAMTNAESHASPVTRHILLAVLGGLFFAGDLAAWNTAVLIGNVANATLLANTSPLWVGVGALILFKEKLRPLFWGGLLLAMLGVAVILGQDFLLHPSLGQGDLLGLAAGFFYGMFFLAAERARDKLSSLGAWWVSVATSAMVLFGLSVVLQQSFTGYAFATYANLIALALITQVGGWLAVSYALGHLPASIVSPTLLGQPVFTAILAVPLLGQPLGAVQVAGGLVVLAGILIVHRSKG